MDFHEAIQCSALLAVLEPDSEALTRQVQRGYSKFFCTPLHVVKTLPIEDVYQAYWEQIFSDLTEEAQHNILDVLSQTQEDRIKETQTEEAWEQALTAAIKEDIQKGGKGASPRRKKNTPQETMDRISKISKKPRASEGFSTQNTPLLKSCKSPSVEDAEDTVVSIDFS
jgi:hypothetical protein